MFASILTENSEEFRKDVAAKFSEPCRVISDNPLFGHSQPIRSGIADDPHPAQPRGVGARYELRASDVLAIGKNCHA